MYINNFNGYTCISTVLQYYLCCNPVSQGVNTVARMACTPFKLLYSHCFTGEIRGTDSMEEKERGDDLHIQQLALARIMMRGTHRLDDTGLAI